MGWAGVALPVLPFASERLRNGLELYVQPDAASPAVHIELWYRVGSRDDPPGRAGLAHLVAHLFERGTRHHGDRAYRSQLLAVGAVLAPVETTPDYTRFAVTVPAAELERALWLESSRMGWTFDRPGIRSALADERAVIAHEQARVGEASGLTGVGADEVERFYDRYFGPDNALLVLAGAIESARARELVQKYFGPIAPGRPPRRPPPPAESEDEPAARPPRPLPAPTLTAGPGLVVAWPSAAAYADGEAALEVAAEYLGGGAHPRLARRLVDERKLARRVTVRQHSHEQQGRFEIAVEIAPDGDPRAALRALDEELAGLRAGKPAEAFDERALAGARARVVTRRLAGLATPAGRARALARYRVLAGDVNFLRRDLERIAAVDATLVKAVLAGRLRDDTRVVVTSGGVRTGLVAGSKPGMPARVAPAAAASEPAPPRRSPDAAFRAQPPAAASARAPKRAPSGVQRFRLPGGLPAALVTAAGAPVVRAELIVPLADGGDGADADATALARQAAALLAAAPLSPGEVPFAEALARLGALPETHIDRDALSLAMVLPRGELARAGALWAAALDPGRWSRADRADVTAARAAFARLFRSEGTTLVLAGAVTAADAGRAFAGMLPRREARPAKSRRPPARREARAPSAPVAPARPQVVLRDRPGAGDAELRLAATGPAPGTREHAAMLVTDQLLGGELGRLDRRLRLEKGWALWVRSEPGAGPGGWTIETRIPAAQAAAGLRELLRAVNLLAAGEVTEAEVRRARATLLNRRPVERSNPFALAQAVAREAAHGGTEAAFAAEASAIAAVGPEDVTRVVRAHLLPPRSTVTVTGDRRRLEPALEEAGLELARERDAAPARAAAMPAAAMR